MVTNFQVKISKLLCSFIYLQLVYLMTPYVTENMGLYDVQATDVVAHILSVKCGKINTSAAIVVNFFLLCHTSLIFLFLVPSSHFDMYCSYIGELRGEIQKGNFWC
jgi:hypothetical protein